MVPLSMANFQISYNLVGYIIYKEIGRTHMLFFFFFHKEEYFSMKIVGGWRQ